MTRAESTDTREDGSFDCIAFKRRVQAEIYEETKHMTSEEVSAYYHRRVAEGPFGKWWGSLPKATQVVREHPGDGGTDDRGASGS